MEFDDIIKDLQNGENMGGVAMKGYYGAHADVATWPVKPTNPATLAAAGALTGSIEMKEGKRMYEFDITDDTGELVIDPVGELDGKSFIMRYRFFQPGLQEKILGLLNATKNKNMVFIVPDNNGCYFVLGDALRAATFQGSPDGAGTAKETAGRRGVSFEFAYKTSNVYQYKGTIPLTVAVES